MRRHWLISCALLAAAHLGTGLAGLSLASFEGQVSLLWAPTGIGLAAVFLGGPRLALGVFVGSLLVNLWAGSGPLVAVLIAIGASLEALAGARLLRWGGFDARLERLRDVGLLLGLGILPGALLGAFIGTGALLLGGIAEPWELPRAWLVWFLGDATGVLIVAPALLVWLGPGRQAAWAAVRQAPISVGGGGIAVLLAAFSAFFDVGPLTIPLSLVPFLAIFGAALRHGLGAAMPLVLGTAALAVAGDAVGAGPFVGSQASAHSSTWAYLLVLGCSMLVTAALLAERAQAAAERLVLEQRAVEAQRMEALGLVAAGVAHDFNNLFQAIRANAELLGMRDPGSRPVARIHGAVLRGADLCRQLEAYAGKAVPHPEAIRLPELVRESQELLGVALPDGVQLDLRLGAPGPAVQVDRRQLQQVVMNLVQNAGEAMAEVGGGTVEVRTGEGPIDEGTLSGADVRAQDARAGEYGWVEVVDAGPGIDPAIRPRLFEPFVTTRFSGRGLGMAAVAGIARGLHGAVFVDSAPGRGTRVRVAWPRDAAGPERLSPRRGPDAPSAADPAGSYDEGHP